MGALHVFLRWILILLVDVTHCDKEWMRSRCPEYTHAKGIVFSLFGTIKALNKMKQEGLYDLDYMLGFGTLLAFERNSTILPWDRDSDLILIFKPDLNQTELQQFAIVLEQQVNAVLNTTGATLKWVFKDMHPGIMYHSLWVRGLEGSTGCVDIFIFFHSEIEGKLVSWHKTRGAPPPNFFNESLIVPVQYNLPWAAYDDFKVNIPAQDKGFMEKCYGADWRIPDVSQKRLDCPKPSQSLLRKWMKRINGEQLQSTPNLSEPANERNFHDENIRLMQHAMEEPIWYHYITGQLLVYCAVIFVFCRVC